MNAFIVMENGGQSIDLSIDENNWSVFPQNIISLPVS